MRKMSDIEMIGEEGEGFRGFDPNDFLSNQFGFGNLGFRSSDDFIPNIPTPSTNFHNNQQNVVGQSCVQSEPIGLTLKRTASFLSQWEMLHYIHQQEFTPREDDQGSDHDLPEDNQGSNHDSPQGSVHSRPRRSRKANSSGSPRMPQKLKASNFPIASITIGGWQRSCRNEGDLVAKIYYAKKKLVWEVVDGPLKSKIEMPWSDISAFRATMNDDQAFAVLEIELGRPPSFFREINPQPRKHTIWQQASDFTGGEASHVRHAKHSVRFHPGVLDKHYQQLLQCDERLSRLSRESFPSPGSPFFNSALHQPGISPAGQPYDRGAPATLTPNPTFTVVNIPRGIESSRPGAYDQGLNTHVGNSNPQWSLDSAQGDHVCNPPHSHHRSNHLLGNSQVVCRDQGTVLADILSMSYSLDPSNDSNQSQMNSQISGSQRAPNPTYHMQQFGGLNLQPTNWSPTPSQVSNGGTRMMPEVGNDITSFMSPVPVNVDNQDLMSVIYQCPEIGFNMNMRINK